MVGDRVLVVLNVLALLVAGKTCFDVLASDDNTVAGDSAYVIGPIVFTVVSMLLSLASRPNCHNRRDWAMNVQPLRTVPA